MITYSVIIPVKDEVESLQILYHELTTILDKLRKPYELIFVDDGSTDNSLAVLKKIGQRDKKVQIINFRANFGKSQALSNGFKRSKGEIIITMDADLQDDPADIPQLIEKLQQGYDLVNGWRQKRSDTIVKKISSFFFNKGTALISGVKLHDFNCGMKILRKEVVDELFIYGELHRFIPILAAKLKFKVTELPVRNRQRRYGNSKYGFGRSWRGILDLLTIIFITDYATKPAHFFGKIGLLFFSVGFVMDFYVTSIKITTGTTQGKTPLLLAGILFILLGIQLLSTGLIAEMITHAFFTKRNNK